MSRIFGGVRQIGYVVRDLRQAIAHWTQVLGVGPFFLVENARAQDYLFRGTPSDAAVDIALSCSGSMQIELFSPCDDKPSMAREFLDAGHVGIQHHAHWFHTPAAMDEALARADELGYRHIHSGRFGADGRFVHLERDDIPGIAIELSEVCGWKAELFQQLEVACRDWDGVTDPVRRASPPVRSGG